MHALLCVCSMHALVREKVRSGSTVCICVIWAVVHSMRPCITGFQTLCWEVGGGAAGPFVPLSFRSKPEPPSCRRAKSVTADYTKLFVKRQEVYKRFRPDVILR